MSSDLLEECIDNDGREVFLSMNFYGTAFLTIFVEVGDNGEDRSENFVLTPDEKGIKNAKMIESALKSWRERIEETRLNELNSIAQQKDDHIHEVGSCHNCPYDK